MNLVNKIPVPYPRSGILELTSFTCSAGIFFSWILSIYALLVWSILYPSFPLSRPLTKLGARGSSKD